MVSSLELGGTGYAFLVSADGTILAHPDKDLLMKSLSDIYPQIHQKSAHNLAKPDRPDRPAF
jgi:methyl-accepting chemotaxis protein